MHSRETALGSCGTVDSSICSSMVLDQYTSTACYHRKVTSSRDSCHLISKDLSTCNCQPVCLRLSLRPAFAVTNESQTHVNTRFTLITPLKQWKYIASTTGDTLTCPWTLSFPSPDQAVSILTRRTSSNYPQVPKACDKVVFSPFFFLSVGCKGKDQRVYYSTGELPLLAMNDISAGSEMIH